VTFSESGHILSLRSDVFRRPSAHYSKGKHGYNTTRVSLGEASSVTPERYRQIRAQFEAALEQPGPSRHQFLRETCAGDAELLAEVELMLNADQQVEGPIDKSAIPFESLAADHSPSVSFEGRVIGAWRLDRLIGHGGMGSVYLAHRADGAFHKRAAIKVMRADLKGQGFLQRFEQEKEILASLEHPNIARLLDGGRTSEGLSYLVMEYVEGQPITAYCDAHKLDISARLTLSQKVCLAVQHLHKHLLKLA
jgi:eukaryotic-like serine/threonine-protein kinase